MDMELFELILERVGDRKLEFVTLNIYNEPLLHPDFLQQAQLLARVGQPLALFTTAALLQHDTADALMELGNVDRIVVNFPAADADGLPPTHGRQDAARPNR